MKIASLSLPHPVLGHGDDMTGKYEVDLVREVGPDFIKIETHHHVVNPEIAGMMRRGEACYVTHVHCQRMCFRVAYVSEVEKQEICIPSGELDGKVELEFFITASSDILSYSPQTAHEDYRGRAVPVRRGAVLGFGGEASFLVDKNPFGNGVLSSFVTVIEGDHKRGPLKFDLNGDSLAIILSHADFETFRGMSGSRMLDPIFHATLVLPALAHAVAQVCREEVQFSDRKWYEVLEDKRKNDPALRDESWTEDNAIVLAQKILELPFGRSMEAVVQVREAGGRG